MFMVVLILVHCSDWTSD